MTGKTKADLEAEIRELKADSERLAEFKKRVTEVTAEEIENNSLDLCADGLDNWADRLGIESPAAKKPHQLTLIVGMDAKTNITDSVDYRHLERALAAWVEKYMEDYHPGATADISVDVEDFCLS